MSVFGLRCWEGRCLAGVLPFVLPFVLVLAMSLGASVGVADEPDEKQADAAEWPKPLMRDVFASMSYLLPRGLDKERFASPSERAGIMSHIHALADSAAKLENHGLDRGSSLSFLSFSLARDVEEVRMRYSTGLYEEARYFLVGSIQNCFVSVNVTLARPRHPSEMPRSMLNCIP